MTEERKPEERVSRPGHMCSSGQLLHVLRVAGADKDEDGKFLIEGSIVSFMGMGEEMVVSPDAVYFRNGQRCNVALALQGTSYGTKIVVI